MNVTQHADTAPAVPENSRGLGDSALIEHIWATLLAQAQMLAHEAAGGNRDE